MVPDGWKEYQLADVAKFEKGVTYSAKHYANKGNGLPFITIKCFNKGGGFDWSGLKFYTGLHDDRQKVQHGDIAIAATDLTREGDIIGSPLLIPDIEAGKPILISMDLCRIICDLEKIDPTFMYYHLMTDTARQFMKAHSGGSTVLHLNTKAVLKMKLVLPPLSEQKKIAEILSSVDKVIASTQAVIDQTRKVKQGLLQQLLTRGIGHSRFKESEIGRIPESWEVVYLDSVATRGTGHTPSRKKPEYWNGGIKWLSLNDSKSLDSGEVYETVFNISKNGLENSSAVLHPQGTVVLTRDGSRLGKSAILGCEMAVSQHYVTWTCGSRLNNYFLYWWLQYKKAVFAAIASGSTIPTIGVPYFKKLKIALPSLPEQVKIVSIIFSINNAVNTHSTELFHLNELKRGLMQDLLTGRVLVGVNS